MEKFAQTLESIKWEHAYGYSHNQRVKFVTRHKALDPGKLIEGFRDLAMRNGLGFSHLETDEIADIRIFSAAPGIVTFHGTTENGAEFIRKVRAYFEEKDLSKRKQKE